MSKLRDPRILLILGFAFTAVSPIYFRLFPIIHSPVISDILLTACVFFSILSVIWLSLLQKNTIEFVGVLILISLNVFIFRSIRYFRTGLPVLFDPYVHLATLTNVLETGYIEPGIVEWATVLNKTSYFFGMYVTSAQIIAITGISKWGVFRYQSPLFGIALFSLITALGYSLTGSRKVAVLGGFISSMTSNVIFYQSEYHPQGYSLVLLILTIYTFVKSLRSDSVRYEILTLVAVVGLIFSHYFTPLIFAPVFGLVAIGIRTRTLLGEKEILPRISGRNRVRLFPAFVLGIGIITYHFVTPAQHLTHYIGLALASSPANASLATTDKPIFTDITRSVKWVILGLALPTLIHSIWNDNKQKLALSGFILAFLAVGIVGQYGLFISVGRVVTFYSTIIGIMVAITILKFTNADITKQSWHRKTTITCIVVAGMVTITVFGGHFLPAYYFHSSEENESYWSQNYIPSMSQYPSAGTWMGTNGPDKFKVIGEGNEQGFTTVAGFIWGRIPIRPGIFPWIDGPPAKQIDGSNYLSDVIDQQHDENAYFLVNQHFSYGISVKQRNRVYSNGELEILT